MAKTTTKVTPITSAPSAGKPKATGTAVAVKKTGAVGNVINIRDMLKKQAESMSERTAPASGNFIRVTQDKQFMLPDGTKTPGPLQLVIVDFIASNRFYESAFDSKNPTPPACFAIDTNPQKMAPSPNAPLPQAKDCQTCPMNQFGSDGDGKACKNSRILAVLPPDADEDTPLWLLGTSPTANKGFDGFVSTVARVFQMPPVGVVATVGFDPTVTYAKLTFSDPQPLADELLEAFMGRQEEAKAMLTTEPDVSKFVPAAKVPARKAARR
jgi:hypothetical protein